MFSEDYVRLILALAPLVVCLAFSLEESWWLGRRRWVCLVAATLFGASVFGGPLAIWAAFPWMFVIGLRAVREVLGFLKKPDWELSNLARIAALAYLPVGGVWALFDQAKFQPMGFSGIIVLLTGVHFHYAGFALPRLTGLWLERQTEGGIIRGAAWGVILGVPLVAVGITTSQMNMPVWIETVSVTLLALSAFTVSLGQLRWAIREPMPWEARTLFVLGGVALAGGMVLATIYGWRHYFPVAWATIPSMYAVHGTLNSLGFCLPGFVAWKRLSSKS